MIPQFNELLKSRLLCWYHFPRHLSLFIAINQTSRARYNGQVFRYYFYPITARRTARTIIRMITKLKCPPSVTIVRWEDASWRESRLFSASRITRDADEQILRTCLAFNRRQTALFRHSALHRIYCYGVEKGTASKLKLRNQLKLYASLVRGTFLGIPRQAQGLGFCGRRDEWPCSCFLRNTKDPS